MAGKAKTKQITTLIRKNFSKDELLGLVAQGTTLRKLAEIVGDKLGIPALTHYYVFRVLKDYGPDYEEAKRAKAQTLADRVDTVSDQVEAGHMDPASARVISDNSKWLAARLDPGTFGDKIQADIRVTDLGAQHLAALKQMMSMKVRQVQAEAQTLSQDQDEDPEVGQSPKLIELQGLSPSHEKQHPGKGRDKGPKQGTIDGEGVIEAEFKLVHST